MSVTTSHHKPLRFQVQPIRPHAHLFAVELCIPLVGEASNPRTIALSMPAWIPGSYMIRDFAKNLIGLMAEGPSGPLPLTQIDKDHWQLDLSCLTDADEIRVRYQVYAWELSVRAAHLDTTHGYFNGPSLFLRVDGRDREPCLVELLPPPAEMQSGEALSREKQSSEVTSDWRVATSLARVTAEPWGFGTYSAEDYEDLIDHPVEMGRFERMEFRVRGVPHWMVLVGRHRADLDRIGRDLAMICEQQAQVFGELPVDRYLFLTTAVGDGYGGLEHRFSTSLLCSRDDLPDAPPAAAPDASTNAPLSASASAQKPTGKTPSVSSLGIDKGYRRFLGLCSHEYFHLWHVKRIRPAVFADATLEREVHTRLLWAFEGITSYYDDLALVRSGLIDARSYLELLAETITRVQRTPGRLRQTVAESSFDAWTKFYKQDENAPNAIVSYYAKGALVALALDLTIRRETAGRQSLDDIMRALWQRHGKTSIGVDERGIEALAAEVTGLDLSDFFAHALDSTEDLDLASLLADLGIRLHLRAQRDAKDMGSARLAQSTDSVAPEEAARAEIGVRLRIEDGQASLAVVLDDRPAQCAGLAPGDQLIAIDGLKVDAGNAEARLRRARIGEPLEIHAFRRDELMQFLVLPEPAPADTCDLLLIEDVPDAVRMRRADWLSRDV